MSTTGFVEDEKYERRRQITFGCLISIVLLFLLAVISSGILLGCYLVSHRDDDILFQVSLNSSQVERSDYGYEPVHQDNDPDIYDVVSTHHSVTSVASLPPTSVQNQPDGQVNHHKLSEVIEEIWQASLSRYLAAGTDYALHFQGKTNQTENEDRAPKKLFQKMTSDIRRYSPIHRKFVRLLNNYEVGDDDILGRREREEEDFLNELLRSGPFIVLERFLSDQKLFSTSFSSEIYDLWFKKLDGRSSAFETVFVGVKHESRVFGLNNWIQFYLQEKAKRINYHGYLSKNQIGLLQLRFTWDGIMKPLSTMFIGTSPDFELALYSLCYFVRGTAPCLFSLQGQDIIVAYNESTQATEFIINISDTLT
ncbi:hypothetical protein LSH36_32g14053 [Paralvinella palmiformis]|uniref:Uridylate-specific endoribonuclease n=1 Tax=Paralvinella palmiformis TaxID=53620 RepID=A0AAD9K9A1_9ANNE|nr:hypothetical protein LSH36_32g14053 [Paralvinella palmiformis]